MTLVVPFRDMKNMPVDTDVYKKIYSGDLVWLWHLLNKYFTSIPG